MIQIPALKKNKAIIIVLAALVGAFCLLWLLVQVLVDKEEVAKSLFDGIKGVTGYEARARSVSLSFFPQPAIVLERMEIDNHPKASTDKIFLSEEVEVTLDLMELLTGTVKVGTLTIVRPVVELEIFQDKTSNWDFINKHKKEEAFFITPHMIIVEGGSVKLTDTFTQQAQEYDAINIAFEFDEASHDIDLEAAFSAFERNVEINGIFVSKAFSSLEYYSFGVDLDIKDGENRVVYKGAIGQDRYGYNYDGVFDLNFTDVMPWIEIIFSRASKDGIFENFANPVPFKFSGKAFSSGEKFSYTDLSLQSGESSGNGQIVSDANVFPQTQATFKFSVLDLSAIFDPKRPVSEEAFNSFVGQLLPEGISSSVDINVDKFVVSGVPSKDARLAATLDGGEMVINQAVVHMPGDTELLLFGILKRSLDDAVQFDGSVELLGKRMLELAHAFGFEQDKFVTDHDGEFRAKANVFLSKANSVVTDFKLQAGTLLASGGMTNQAGREIENEFTLRFSGMKLDPFAPLFIPTSQKDLKKSDFEDIMRRLDWLDQVKSKLQLNLVLQNYSLSKTTGDQSTLRIILEPGKISFKDTRFELGGIMLSGALSYDQREEVPMIEAEMDISHFNLEPYTANNLRKSPVPRGNFQSVWSEQHFSFSYLKGYNSKLDIGFGLMEHPDFPMNNMRLVADSVNGKWDIKSFRADLWDGSVKANGTLDVTSIPSLAIGFSFEEIDSVRLFEAFSGHSNFRGTLSLNGQFNTSGINTHNWIKNGRGTFVTLGQNIVVNGFDVSSLVQAIPSVRTVADVVNTARVSMLRRYTTFALVEGGFYMEGGVIKPSELKLRAKHSIGMVAGQMDLVSWNMDCGIDFGLISLARGDYPMLGIHFKNSMDDPEVTLDTRSLEGFIARKKLR